jgi:hypothetical protein
MYDSMIKLKKPNAWSCSITAFAMATDLLIIEFIAGCGHDGSEMVFPQLGDPAGRRGFHEQELVAVCIQHGFTCTPFELWPVAAYDPAGLLTRSLEPRREMFAKLIATNVGVITGNGVRCGHAVAFERGVIYDPDGPEYPFSFEACESRGFFPGCLWLVKRG